MVLGKLGQEIKSGEIPQICFFLIFMFFLLLIWASLPEAYIAHWIIKNEKKRSQFLEFLMTNH